MIASQRQNILFLGTPEFALPSLRLLVASNRFNVVGVLTKPDKEAGRGRKLTPSPVKIAALELGLPVLQPTSLSEDKFSHSFPPLEALVVVAYGKIIPTSFMKLSQIGAVNVHPSLLPRFRGAAPIQHAIFSGDAITGVSIMKLDEGLDTGPVYGTKTVSIGEDESYGTLHDRLAVVGAEMLVEYLPKILAAELHPEPQKEIGVSYATKWEEEDLCIVWEEEVEITLRRIRASSPHPGARAHVNDKAVKIYKAHRAKDKNYGFFEAGTIVETNRAELIIAAGKQSFLAIDEMQFAGKKVLPITEILKGHTFVKGERFLSPQN